MEQTITKTSHPHIIKKTGVCGGRPVIEGTRIPVWCIVGYIRMGMDVEEIVQDFPFLNMAQVYDALSYYYDNQKEIDEEYRLNNDVEHWMKLYPPTVTPENGYNP